jgi:hypothetical protein
MTPGTKSGGGAEKDKHSAEIDKVSAENDKIKVPKKSAETGGHLFYWRTIGLMPSKTGRQIK